MKKHKTLPIIMSVFIVLLSILPNIVVDKVAAQTELEPYKNGVYQVPFKILQDTNDNLSMTKDYLISPGELTINNNEYTMKITLKNSSWWQYLKTQNQPGTFADNNFSDVKVISEDKSTDSRVVEFKVADIDQMVNAKIHVIVPMINYDNKYDIRMEFDTTNIPREEPEVAAPVIADGEYTIEYNALHGEENKPSSMGRYVDKPAKLSVENGQQTVTFKLLDNRAITGFKTEQSGEFEEASASKIDEENNTREVSFEIANLNKLLNSKVQVSVPAQNYVGNHDVRFEFKVNSLVKIETETPVDPVDPEKPSEPKQEISDGEYTIDYRVLHGEENKESSMGKYVDKPAKLTVRNGENKITLKLLDHTAITSFKTEQEGSLRESAVTKIDVANNFREVTFSLDNLDELLKSKVQVSVPAQNYVGNHDVRFEFNSKTIKKNDTPQIPNPEKPVTPDPEKPVTPDPKYKYKNGTYEVPFNILQDLNNKPSVTKDYLVSPAKITVKDGKYKAVVTLNNSSWWQYLKIQDKQPGSFKDNNFTNVKLLSEDKSKDQRVVEFNIQDIDQVLNAKIHVIVPTINYDNKYDIRFDFDTKSMLLENGKNPTSKPNEKPTSKPNEKINPDNLVNGVYSIDYKVFKPKTNELSMVNDYFVTPGKLNVQDGKITMAIEIKNSAWVTHLKTMNKQQLQQTKILSVDKENDSRVVEFPVEDLNKRLSSEVKVDIADINYHNTYAIELEFNNKSIQLLSETDYPQDEKVSQGITYTEEELEALSFNRSNDNKSIDKMNEHKNPKTGDQTKLIFFAGLLMVSLISLGVGLRKKII